MAIDRQAILLTWYGAEKDIGNKIIVLAEEGGLSRVGQYDGRVCQETHAYLYGSNWKVAKICE
jgi:hypothetical protein